MEIELNEIQRLADMIVNMYRRQLETKGINASSTLSNTARAVVDIKGNHLLISLNLEPYWRYVEYGRKAGKMPPIDAIAEWIKIKPIVPNPINGKVPDTRQLAFLIARKIGREGIQGRKPLTNIIYSDTTESIIQDIKSEIQRQLSQVVFNDL